MIRSDQVTADMLAETVMQRSLAQAAEAERFIDAEMAAMNDMSKSNLDKIRKKRINDMKEEQKKKREWRMKGHGTYTV